MVWGLEMIGSRLGYDVIRKAKSDRLVRQLERFFNAHPIDLVIDCGGNKGQFGILCRKAAYSGPIISFEPLARPFANLAERAQSDGNWRALMTGIGETAGHIDLNVSSGATELSSAFEAEPAMIGRFPGLKDASRECVSVRRLDEVLDTERITEDVSIFLKSDTQGYDLHVLRGLGKRIAQVNGLLLEMSVVPLYKGSPTHWQMLDFAREAGFEP